MFFLLRLLFPVFFGYVLPKAFVFNIACSFIRSACPAATLFSQPAVRVAIARARGAAHANALAAAVRHAEEAAHGGLLDA